VCACKSQPEREQSYHLWHWWPLRHVVCCVSSSPPAAGAPTSHLIINPSNEVDTSKSKSQNTHTTHPPVTRRRSTVSPDLPRTTHISSLQLSFNHLPAHLLFKAVVLQVNPGNEPSPILRSEEHKFFSLMDTVFSSALVRTSENNTSIILII
jgi:hypothetical protein